MSSGAHHLLVEEDVHIIKNALKSDLKAQGPAVGIRKSFLEEMAFKRWALKGEQGED